MLRNAGRQTHSMSKKTRQKTAKNQKAQMEIK